MKMILSQPTIPTPTAIPMHCRKAAAPIVTHCPRPCPARGPCSSSTPTPPTPPRRQSMPVHMQTMRMLAAVMVMALVTAPLAHGLQQVCSPPTLPCARPESRCIKGRCVSDARPCSPPSAGVVSSPCAQGYSCIESVCILDLDLSSGAIYKRCVIPSSATPTLSVALAPSATPASSTSDDNGTGGDASPSSANPTNRSSSPPEPPRPSQGMDSTSPDTPGPSPFVIDPSIKDKDAALDVPEAADGNAVGDNGNGGCSPAFSCSSIGICTSPDGRHEVKGFFNATTLLRDRNDLAPPLDLAQSSTSTSLPPTSIPTLPPVAPCLLLKHLAISLNLARWHAAGPPNSSSLSTNASYLTLDDLTGHSCCTLPSYHGIDCGGGEDIRKLVLINRNLSGTLDPYLWPRLKRLATLSLEGNPGLLVPPADVSPMSFLLQVSFANGPRFPGNAFPSWLFRVPRPSMLAVYVGNTSLSGPLNLPRFPSVSPRAISAPDNPQLSDALDDSVDSVALDLRGSGGVCVSPFSKVPGAPVDRSSAVLDLPMLAGGSDALVPLSPGKSGRSAVQGTTAVTVGIIGDDELLDGAKFFESCSLPTLLLTMYWRELAAPFFVVMAWSLGVLWRALRSRFVNYSIKRGSINDEPNCNVFSSPFTLLTMLSIVVELQFAVILLANPNLFPTSTSSSTSASFATSTDSTSSPPPSTTNSSLTLVSATLLAILKLITLITIIIPRMCNGYYTFRLPGLPLLLRVLAILDIWTFLRHFRTRAVKHSPSRTYVPPHLWSLALLQLVLKESAQVAVGLWAWAIAKRTTVTAIIMVSVAVVGVLKEMGMRVRWAWPSASVHGSDQPPPEMYPVQRTRTREGVDSPHLSTFPVEDESAPVVGLGERIRHPWAWIARAFGRRRGSGQESDGHRQQAQLARQTSHGSSSVASTAVHIGVLDASGVPLQYQATSQRASPSPVPPVVARSP